MVYGLSLLPTKTSHQLVQSFGRSPSLIKTFSRVFTISLVNHLFLLILVAIIWSSVSLSFITHNHLDLISWLLWFFSWITLLHLRAQIRKADSNREKDLEEGSCTLEVFVQKSYYAAISSLPVITCLLTT